MSTGPAQRAIDWIKDRQGRQLTDVLTLSVTKKGEVEYAYHFSQSDGQHLVAMQAMCKLLDLMLATYRQQLDAAVKEMQQLPKH